MTRNAFGCVALVVLILFSGACRGPVAPTVTSFAINNGASSSATRSVTLDDTCTSSPTHYMASESPSFTGAPWLSYSTAAPFTLSAGNGTKTVHFKVKNAAGESTSVSDTITLSEPLVPDVVGMTQEAAQTAITGASLTVGTVTEQHHATVPAGQVISQDPAASASVAPGSAVALVISLGPVIVPDLVGMTQATAETVITDAGLTVGTVTQEHHATLPAGQVISQNPAASASVAPGSAVNLVISLGPVIAPNVVGMTEGAANTAITGVGLTVGTVIEQHHATVPAGQVISQDPAASASVAPGSAVALVVSLGPVIVPDVIGLTEAAASTAITEADLTVGTVIEQHHATVPAGQVISQDPAASASVAPGSAVALVVSLGPVIVPDVIGLTEAAASTVITEADLTVGTVAEQRSGTVPVGQVISQTPTSGSSVAPGAAVNLVVSSGPPVGPQADFEADVTSGDAPLTVEFTDLSDPGDSPITAWAWNFGDGEESDEQDPTHVYQEPGLYDVALTVTTAVGQDLKAESNFISVTGERTMLLPGDVPLVMVWIPAGTFTMGRYPGEQDSFDSEAPQHQVTLSHGFWMGKYELTKRQWQAVMGTTPWVGHENILNDLDSPAVYVSWNDAQAFFNDLGDYTGLTCRLPSEAEWEYACRAGTTTRFYWGDDPTYTQINSYAWWSGNVWDANERYAHVVGQKLPNEFGLYDMSGNVWEWCEDDLHSSYTGAPSDGSAWVDSPRGVSRMLRGGSWINNGSMWRSAHRDNGQPSGGLYSFGFRLVADELPTPVVSAFSINDGSPSTNSPTVALNSVCSTPPTHYMASESEDFFGAAWLTYDISPFFTLSSGNGTKTIYFKVKNGVGESNVVSDTVIWDEPDPGATEMFMLPGDVPLEMVWIPAGTFMMGRYPGEQDSNVEEEPRHQVTLSQGFWMAKYALTKAQWTAVMGTTPWAGQTGVNYDTVSPAIYVSWNDAQDFAAALNADTGLTFRLPSEAQREYAARAGTSTRFYWGDDPTYTLMHNYAWFEDNAWDVNERFAHDVGQKLPNAFGLYDMSGNIWEWCQDDWHANYTGAPSDGSAWVDSPRGTARGLRGGSFGSVWGCRSAYRGGDNPPSANYAVGFRLSR